MLITAPGKDVDATIVMGVNDDTYEPGKHHVISNASCTTNCAAPMAAVLDEAFGIVEGLMGYANRTLDLADRIARALP